MIRDDNFWKNRYASQWKESNEKEKQVGDLISTTLGVQVEFSGFGAGSTEFIDGSARSNGHSAGDADLHIVGTNHYIEVTGSHKPISFDADIWIRPDKIRHATRSNQDITLVHYVVTRDRETVFRAIPFNEKFLQTYYNKGFRLATPFIRGQQERFIVVDPNSEFVLEMKDWLDLMAQELPNSNV